jgi:predicted aspartyl protease
LERKIKRRNVLLDTGSGITVVSKEIVRNLGLEVAEGRLIHLKTIAADVHAPLARLDSIQLGTLSSIDFPVAVTDLTLGERHKAWEHLH